MNQNNIADRTINDLMFRKNNNRNFLIIPKQIISFNTWNKKIFGRNHICLSSVYFELLHNYELKN
jgi:hypothetical protein